MNVMFEKQYSDYEWDNFINRPNDHYETYITDQENQTLFLSLDYFINHDISKFD